MASGLSVQSRHKRILSLIKERGGVSVNELSGALEISPVTVRRDLDFLGQQGFLIRKHGGASPIRTEGEVVPERKFVEKGTINTAEKERIAEYAARLIMDDEILFMNSGSTALFFLQALKGKKVKIITNNAAAINCDRDPLVELMLLGGDFRDQSRSLVGELAIRAIKDIYSSHTILGTNGISLERGLTTSVYQECSVNQAMIQNTHGNVIVLADYSKIGKVSNFVSSPLATINVVVTDDKCPDEFRRRLTDLGIKVYVA